MHRLCLFDVYNPWILLLDGLRWILHSFLHIALNDVSISLLYMLSYILHKNNMAVATPI